MFIYSSLEREWTGEKEKGREKLVKNRTQTPSKIFIQRQQINV
jgi:hypothetical protein